MTEEARDDAALHADLAALRGALRELRAPDDREAALLAAYRARLGARASELAPPAAATTSHARRARRPLALAAAALLAVAAVTALVSARVERAAPRAVAAVDGVPETPKPTTAFRPLAFARGVSASESYSVVRVRIQLATFVAGAGAPSDAAIEADLLVGEDGLARAIRFDSADTLFVSTVTNESGETR